MKTEDTLPKQTIVGDRVRIRLDNLDMYQQLWPHVTKDTVFQIVGHRKTNDRNVWIVDGDGPREVFTGHVSRAWGNTAERLEGLRAAGAKLP